MRLLDTLYSAAALAALTTASVEAQTLYTLDGGAGIVDEITGPPAGFCGYPTGPLVGGFPYALGFVCAAGTPPTPAPIFPPAPFGIAGGMTTNPITDTVFVTDGFVITEYTSGGGPIAGWPAATLAGPITGMAFDGAAGMLFITDGAFCAGLFPPAGGCAAPIVAIPPWPALPAGSPLITGLAWDPGGFLWAVDVGGVVSMIPVGGPGGPAFPVVPDPVCGALGGFGPMQGIALDTASLPGLGGGPPALYVTDGAIIVYLVPGGGPAAPTFYTTANCLPVPGGPISGLAYTSHGIVYGKGTDPTGILPPTAATKGQFTSPSGPVAIDLAGADPTPGGMTVLTLSLGFPFGAGAACPPIPGLGGNLIQVAPPFAFTLGPFPIPPSGAVTLPGAIPPGFAGIQIMGQWFVGKGSGGIQTSNGVEFTIGIP